MSGEQESGASDENVGNESSHDIQNGQPFCCVVCIGASAGGLQALSELLDNLEQTDQLCLIIAQHRSERQDHDLLAELLAKHTPMPLVIAEDGMELLPGTVHVVPPNTIARLRDDRFWLRNKEPREMVIDTLFSSLASQAGRHGVAVVLSGSNTDGTLGAREVRASDGLVLAQLPETAEYRTMPQSVIQEGLADDILAPQDIPGRVLDYVRHLRSAPQKTEDGSPRPAYPPELRKKLLSLVEARTGKDFSSYKVNTVNRRIRRRMDVHRLNSLQDYIRLMRTDQDEAQALFREMLIGVTHFFRDPEAWVALKRLLEERCLPEFQDGELRLWAPGCSTGEEAYTLAIIVREALQKLDMDTPVTIYASDLDERAIEKARYGHYPANIAQDVDEARLERFFVNQEGGYKVRRELREMVVFATQNLLRDPPFSHLDLICCRNLLMYLVPQAQRMALGRFQYALKPGGLLFLGTAESVSSLEAPYVTQNAKWRIFSLDPQAKQSEIPSAERTAYRSSPRHYNQHREPKPLRHTPRKGRSSLQRISERFLLEQACPPSVLASRSGDILYIHGRTGAYLELSPGEPGANLLHMARQGLREPLNDALDVLLEKDEIQLRRGVRVKTNDHYETIDLFVRPVDNQDLEQPACMVSFVPTPEPQDKQPPAHKDNGETEAHIRELQLELRHARQNLRAVIEDYEAANEELESSNEELQSTNEELKSTNEELETSREELESINEEQSTLNDELQAKNQELASVNDDMANLLASTRVATLFLDEDLRIKRFTPAMQEFMGVRDQDQGRPVQDMTLRLDYDSLAQDAAEVLDKLDSISREIHGEGQSWYQLRISPYRTTENVIAGVVLTLNDISDIKRKEHEARDAQVFAENLIDSINEPLLVLEKDFTIRSANHAFYDFFAAKKESTEGRSLFSLAEGRWDIPELQKLLQEVIPEKKQVHDYEVQCEIPDKGKQTLRLNARQIATEVSSPCILLVITTMAH